MTDPRHTRRRVGFAAAWLALQVALPLSWYVGSDPLDERFAWRMFSDARRVSCALRLTVEGRHPHPREWFQVGWIKLARRGRTDVLRAMARHTCLQTDRPTSVDARCPLSDGTVRTMTTRATPPCDAVEGP